MGQVCLIIVQVQNNRVNDIEIIDDNRRRNTTTQVRRKNLLMILIIPPMVLNIDNNHTTHGTDFTTSIECGGKYRDGKTPHVDFLLVHNLKF